MAMTFGAVRVGLIEVERQAGDLAAARHDLRPVVDDKSAQRRGEVDGVGVMEHDRRCREGNGVVRKVEADPPRPGDVGQLHDLECSVDIAGEGLGEQE